MAANYITFNDVALNTYSLELLTYPESFIQSTESLQVKDRAWGLSSLKTARRIEMGIAITGDDLADLISNMDYIKKYLDLPNDCKLEIATITDRYWMARFVGMDGNRISATLWKGTVTFDCYDPMAYDNDEEDNDHTII